MREVRTLVVAILLAALAGGVAWAADASPAAARAPLLLLGPGAAGVGDGTRPWLHPATGTSADGNPAVEGAHPRAAARRNARALWPALLSGLVPGAGQVRNGAVLRGLGYFVVEVGSWIAYGSFRDGSRERLGDVARLSAYWDHTRYQDRATDPDSCAFYGCTYGLWSADADSEIVRLSRGDRTRYYEYLTRDAYACGWDSTLSRSIYRETWDDREAMLDAKRWMGRVIFLNHLVSAVDAFIGARSRQLDLGQDTRLHFDFRGLPPRFATAVRVTRTFGGPPEQ